MRRDIVIVGAGPAGCAAAVQCKRLGVAPLLIDKRGRAGGLTENAYSIENYPGLPPTEGPAFAALIGAHLHRFDIPVEQGVVHRLFCREDRFSISGNFGAIHARSVIVSVGTKPALLEAPGAAALRGHGLFHEVADLLSAEKVSQVLVIGGGEAALDYSLTLARAGAEVRVCVRGEQLRAQGRLVDLVARSPLIKIEYNATPRSLSIAESDVAVEFDTSKGRAIKTADAILAAIGRTSRAPQLLNELDVDPFEGVTTRLRGLFVAGDARTGSLGQAGMAVGDGLAAAMAAVDFVGRDR